MAGRTLRVGALGAVAVGFSLCAASCGGGSSSPGVANVGSSTPTSSSGGGYETKLSFSRCMRSHGVSSFPDPSSNGGAAGRSSSLYGIAVPSSIDLRSSAFQAALRSCKQVLSGGAPPPPLTERQEQAALATARCIRTHGFPTWPDPTFTGGEIGISTAGVDVQSAAFKRAEAACGTP
jgi:hypothetical protein